MESLGHNELIPFNPSAYVMYTASISHQNQWDLKPVYIPLELGYLSLIAQTQ